MASINDAFPSKYLKAADLKGKNALVTMDRTEFDMIGDDRRLVLYFEGKEKGVVLNKTNASIIADEYGDDTDEWKGQQIILFEAMVDFKGKTVQAIRVRKPQAKDKPPVRQSSADMRPAPKQQAAQHADDIGDEIPF